MKTVTGIYKGDRIIELTESLELPKDTPILVVIAEQDDEEETRLHLQNAAQLAFARLWDNEVDEIWSQQLPAKASSLYPARRLTQ